MTMAKLFYVMGASGVGKDSLLGYARANVLQHMEKGDAFVFAHRYITRHAEAGGENHIALTDEEFQQRSQNHCFAMCWHSHGNWYGIGAEINQWLEQGLNVVVNGSRTYFNVALEQYPMMVPVLITADRDRLLTRLIKRGRESQSVIEQRLQASASIDSRVEHPALIEIENNGELSVAGDLLIQLLHSADDGLNEITKVKT